VGLRLEVGLAQTQGDPQSRRGGRGSIRAALDEELPQAKAKSCPRQRSLGRERGTSRGDAGALGEEKRGTPVE
jgi:hypothetical protein